MNNSIFRTVINSILIGAGILFPTTYYAQNNALVINGAKIVINGGTATTPAYIVINQNDTAGIIRTTSGGYIQSENQYNYIKWVSGASTGAYVFPFGLSGGYIPMTFNKTSSVSSPIQISSWHTNQQNDPKPLATDVNPVTMMPGVTDSVKYAIDRFWDIQTSPNVFADLAFSYLGSENTTMNPNNVVQAQHWNGSFWDTPVTASNASSGVTSGVGAAGDYLGQNTFSPWVLIVRANCPNDFISYSQNAYCLNDTALQEVSHTNDTLNGAFTFIPSGLDIDPVTGTINPATSTPGDYAITYTVPAAGGCPQVIATTPVSIHGLPNVSVNGGDSTMLACTNDSITIFATGASAYTWTGPSSYHSNDSSITITNLGPLNSGWFYLVASDSNGCSVSDSVVVNLRPLPPVSANSNKLLYCAGENVTLTANAAEIYAWNGPNGFTSTMQNPYIEDFNPSNAGTYIVTITDTNGCVNSDSVTIAVGALTGLSIDASDNSVCPGKTIVLTASGAENYTWTGPNGYSGIGATVNLTDMNATQSGTYYVTGTDSLGCSAVDTITVGVGTSKDCIFIPGLVTPNGDNKNDTWQIPGIAAFPKAEVYIFNRWGNLVFHAAPYKNDWAGQVNEGVDVGKGILPSATYFYVIKLNNGKDKDIKGYIELQY